MTIPDDVENNTIVVLFKANGQIFSKGFRFDPKDKDDTDKKVRQANSMLRRSIDMFVLNRKEPNRFEDNNIHH